LDLTPPVAPSLDVVIVNYNAGGHLRACVEALRTASQSSYRLTSVAIVDNASQDDSLAALSGGALPLSIICNDENRGFGAACNQGAAAGDGELMLLLNPDVRVQNDTLDLCVAFMTDAAHARVGICGCLMIDKDGGPLLSASRLPSIGMLVAKMSGLADVAPRWVRRQRLSAHELPTDGAVEQVIGAFFMIRRSLFVQLGGFDPRFFVYMEEVDLALRAAQAGYASCLVSGARAYHYEGASSRQIGGLRQFYLWRSQTEYARKHWAVWQAPVLATLIIILEVPVRLVLAVRHRSRREIVGIGQAVAHYLRYLLRRTRGGPDR